VGCGCQSDGSGAFGVAGLGERRRLAGTTSRSTSTTYVHSAHFGRGLWMKPDGPFINQTTDRTYFGKKHSPCGTGLGRQAQRPKKGPSNTLHPQAHETALSSLKQS
jgi:hypothetical protein